MKDKEWDGYRLEVPCQVRGDAQNLMACADPYGSGIDQRIRVLGQHCRRIPWNWNAPFVGTFELVSWNDERKYRRHSLHNSKSRIKSNCNIEFKSSRDDQIARREGGFWLETKRNWTKNLQRKKNMQNSILTLLVTAHHPNAEASCGECGKGMFLSLIYFSKNEAHVLCVISGTEETYPDYWMGWLHTQSRGGQYNSLQYSFNLRIWSCLK